MLTGSKILEEVENGGIQITPFDKSQLNPNSYNVRLGGTLKVYTEEVLDFEKDNPSKVIEIPKEGFILQPASFTSAILSRGLQLISTFPPLTAEAPWGGLEFLFMQLPVSAISALTATIRLKFSASNLSRFTRTCLSARFIFQSLMEM